MAIAGSAVLHACSGAVSDQAANPPASLGGFWTGTLTAASGASLPTLMLVTEDGKFFSVAENTATGCADVVAGDLALDVDAYSGSAYFGITNYGSDVGVQVDCAYADGSVSGTADLTGTLVSRKKLTVTADDTTSLGTVIPATTGQLDFDVVYNESSSLSKVSGSWILSTGAVFSISSAGAILSQDPANGCEVKGAVSLINSNYNAYSVSVAYANCGPSASALNGLTATGLMTLDDTKIPSILYVGYSITLPEGEVLMVALNATK
jgi:hypothetical protein